MKRWRYLNPIKQVKITKPIIEDGGDSVLCKRCGCQIQNKSGRRKWCTTCSNIMNTTVVRAYRCKKRGFKPDNGKPYQVWVEAAIRESGKWEPRSVKPYWLE